MKFLDIAHMVSILDLKEIPGSKNLSANPAGGHKPSGKIFLSRLLISVATGSKVACFGLKFGGKK